MSDATGTTGAGDASGSAGSGAGGTGPLQDLVRGDRPLTWAYLDVSRDVPDPAGTISSRATSVATGLRRDGAPDADVAALVDVLTDDPGVAAPVQRFVVVDAGTVVVDEVLPGPAKAAQGAGHGAVPDVLPLLAHRPVDLVFLVAQVGRDGGGFRVHRFGHAQPEGDEHVQGRTDTLHKVRGGGWSHRRWQDHTEELWKQNLTEVATAVDETVRRTGAGLIVVAGDVRARQLLEDALSEQSRALLSVVPVDTRAPEASDDALVAQVETALARVVATRTHDAVDLLRTHAGRGDGQAASTLGEVVQALAAAQVDTLLVDPGALGDRTVLALGDAPWIATAPEDALGAPVLGPVPAASGLARAAVLTDAHVVLAAAGSLPGDAGLGALLRWPSGPVAGGGGSVGDAAS